MPKQCNEPNCSNNVFGGGYCKRHQYRRGVKYLRSFSLKRQKQNVEYFREAKKFIEENPDCAIKSPVCTGKSQHPHHPKGRGKNLRNWDIMIAACDPCNGYVEQFPNWGKEKGFKVSRLAK